MKSRPFRIWVTVAALFGSASASFSLPPCSQKGMNKWHLCEGIFIENGDAFKGQFINNQKSGMGKYTWKNGDTFLGNYKNDKKNGSGLYTYSTGETFEGEFLDGMSHGRGTYTFSDGSKFIGSYNEGQRTGPGKVYFKDGSFFDGEYLRGARTGFGVFVFSNGDKYQGHWEDNKQEGQGVYTWATGDTYSGGWKKGIKAGHGSFSYANGSYFFGDFHNDLKEGWGFYLGQNGYAELCEYSLNEIVKCLNSDIHEGFPVLETVFKSYSANERKTIQSKLKKLEFYGKNVDGIWGRESFLSLVKYSSLYFKNISLNESRFVKKLLSSLIEI